MLFHTQEIALATDHTNGSISYSRFILIIKAFEIILVISDQVVHTTEPINQTHSNGTQIFIFENVKVFF